MDDFRKLTIGGRDFELHYTTQAMMDVSRKFGGIEKFADTVASMGDGAIEVIAWMIALLANQGIKINNYLTGSKEPLIDEGYVMLMMKPKQIRDIQPVLMQVMAEDTGVTIAGTDEEVDEVLEEIKNAERAAE